MLQKISIASLSFSNKSLILSALACSLLGTYTAPASAEVSSIKVSSKDTLSFVIARAAFAVLPSDADPPVCYMQTSNNSVIDLTQLCGKAPTPPVVAVAEIKRDSDSLVTGRVVNNTGKSVKYVRLKYKAARLANAALENEGWLLIRAGTLEPGQTATFKISLTEPSEVRVTSVEWDES